MRISGLRVWLIVCLTAFVAKADDSLDRQFPVRGFCIAAPSAAQTDRFIRFINNGLAPRAENTLILRVDYSYEYSSHPELKNGPGLAKADVKKIVEACQQNHIHLIPQINLLGHQSWANRLGALLRVYPDLDETPWVKMPEKYAWPNPEHLYCKSYCPLHPKVHEIVFDLVDEICDVFESDSFHAGMDEVFYIGEDKCPRCSGKGKGILFAGEVATIRDHLAQKGRKLWIWGDRLLDGKTTGLGEWEASTNGTDPAIDLIPRDVVICDWHYNRADQTAAYFALKGLPTVTCPWNNPSSAIQQVHDIVRLREQSTPQVRDRVLGLVQTIWSGANSFLDEYEGLKNGAPGRQGPKSEAKCFIKTFEEISAIGATARAAESALKTEAANLSTSMPKPGVVHALVLAEAKSQHRPFVDAAQIWLQDFAVKKKFEFDYKTNTKEINSDLLNRYQLIVQLDYPPYGWTPEATNAFRDYIENGKGGWLGFHHATLLGEFDGFKMWPWFSDFMGGIRFKNYIASFVSADVHVEDRTHPVMRGLPETFKIAREEFYTYDRSPRPHVHVLASVDETSYEPKSTIVMGDHPVIWTNDRLPARNVYIFMGHGPDLLDNKTFTKLVHNALLWTGGQEISDSPE